MKKARIALWLIIIGFIALIIFQNKEFFLTKHSFGIDLLVFDYRSPEVYTAILFLLFFIVGVLVAYFFSLFERFKANKTIRALTAANSSLEKMMATLKSDLESFKTGQTMEIKGEADASDMGENPSSASS